MTLAGHPFDTAKVRLQTQSSTNPIYCERPPLPQEELAAIDTVLTRYECRLRGIVLSPCLSPVQRARLMWSRKPFSGKDPKAYTR